MIIEWRKINNLHVEQSKGLSREKRNKRGKKKREFQEDKTMAHILAGRKRLLFFLHRVTGVTGGLPRSAVGSV